MNEIERALQRLAQIKAMDDEMKAVAAEVRSDLNRICQDAEDNNRRHDLGLIGDIQHQAQREQIDAQLRDLMERMKPFFITKTPNTES